MPAPDPDPAPQDSRQPDFQCVDVDSLKLARPRSGGVEHAALWAAEQLGLPDLLRELGLFGHQPTVTLVDLTNTYFEGEAKLQPKARRGRSKEKRSDCPLLTLGLVLDGSGFVRRSEVLAGNVAESGTLAGLLKALEAPPEAVVVMDKGIATEENIQ